MWSCMPTRPGMTVRPERSIVCAPAGIWTALSGPMERILPSAITMAWFSLTGAPVPSITRTLRRTSVGAETVMNDCITAAALGCCGVAVRPARAHMKSAAAMAHGLRKDGLEDIFQSELYEARGYAH